MSTPKNFLSTNSKLERDGIFSWGIPAYRSKSGMLTCPAARDCIAGCYARNGRYLMPNVKEAQEKRLELSLSQEFIPTIDAELKRRKVKKLRVHDSGDFYSRAYLESWAQIARLNPKTLFYAYTKMIPLLDRVELPGNFVIIRSFGGKFDSQINPATQRHARVFSSQSELKAAKYTDTSKRDARALKSINVGLIYHGPRAVAWSA